MGNLDPRILFLGTRAIATDATGSGTGKGEQKGEIEREVSGCGRSGKARRNCCLRFLRIHLMGIDAGGDGDKDVCDTNQLAWALWADSIETIQSLRSSFNTSIQIT